MKRINYGVYIQKRADRLGLADAVLAASLSMPLSGFQAIKNGESQIPIEKLGHLAKTLKVTVNQFLSQKSAKEYLQDDREFDVSRFMIAVSRVITEDTVTLLENKGDISRERLMAIKGKSVVMTFDEFLVLGRLLPLSLEDLYFGDIVEGKVSLPSPAKKAIKGSLVAGGLALIIVAALAASFAVKDHWFTNEKKESASITSSDSITDSKNSNDVVFKLNRVEHVDSKSYPIQELYEPNTSLLSLDITKANNDKVLYATNEKNEKLNLTLMADDTYRTAYDRSYQYVETIHYAKAGIEETLTCHYLLPELDYHQADPANYPVSIRTPDQFLAMSEKTTAIYNLEEDIDFSQLDSAIWTPKSFKGTLRGNHHTISGLHLKGNPEETNTGAIFREAEGEISGLILDDITLTSTAEPMKGASWFIWPSEDSTGDSQETSEVTSDADPTSGEDSTSLTEEEDRARCYWSFLIGSCHGNLCISDVVIGPGCYIACDIPGLVIYGGGFVAGAISATTQYLSFRRCASYANIRSNGSAAGFASFYGPGALNTNLNVSFEDCLNVGDMVADDKAAGFATGTLKARLTRCINVGDIQGKEAGGFIAGSKTADSITANQLINLGSVTASLEGGSLFEGESDSQSHVSLNRNNYSDCYSLGNTTTVLYADSVYDGLTVTRNQLTQTFYRKTLGMTAWSYSGFSNTSYPIP